MKTAPIPNPIARQGILLIDKPVGRTSFSLVQTIRRLMGVKTVGHAGTLDPLASGVMVLLVGRDYTRQSDRFLNQDKEYVATLELGATTDSYDSDGQVTARNDYVPSREEIEQALKRFQGTLQQIPPMFSAKKQGGKKLYELARKGQEVERAPVEIKVVTELLSYTYPRLELRVACSKGTYIRSLAHDLGQVLTCGAHICGLKRTKSGAFQLSQCIDGSSLDKLQLDMLLHEHTRLAAALGAVDNKSP